MRSTIPPTWLLLAAVAMSLQCNASRLGSDADAGMGDVDMVYTGPYADFPTAPILDTSGGTQVPDNAATLFGAAGSGNPSGGPCFIEPEIGSLFPKNWMRLRFRFSAPAGQNLFEIRMHTDNQTNDLVVYTTATQWTMPGDLWTNLTEHSNDRPITVSVRGGNLAAGMLSGPPSLGSTGDITIAPVIAGGTVVYWTTSGGTVLRGFKIGEETVHDILKPTQAGTACVGCHSSTPDGTFVAFSSSQDPGNGDPASIGLRTVDGLSTEPSFLTASAKALLGRTYQQLPTFSAAHWGSGDHTAVSVFNLTNRYELIWTDLEATSQNQNSGWGVLARTGDAKMAAAPVFSHNGQNIVYVSGTSVGAGVTVTDGDLYTIPYANRQGGTASPVNGASSSMYNEFYPAYSPDDKVLAFSRLPIGQSSYNNLNSELYVIPANGGTASRLAANDPPACSGKVSPGTLNSWPKWAPETQSYNGKQYYWLSFSSARVGANPQLYVTGVVVENGVVTTYKALYLWNQPAADGNHTAAWDVFKLIVG